MNIRLTPEQEAIIESELKSGHFHSVEELVSEASQGLREKARSRTAAMPNGGKLKAVREMLAFAEANRTRLEGVSVKEQIHEGHRL